MLKINIQTDQRLVAAAGTPERLLEAGISFGIKIMSITIRALADNAGNVYVGNSPATALAANNDAYILDAGEVLELDVHDFADGYLDLSDIWIDSDNNDEGVCICYFEVVT